MRFLLICCLLRKVYETRNWYKTKREYKKAGLELGFSNIIEDFERYTFSNRNKKLRNDDLKNNKNSRLKSDKSEFAEDVWDCHAGMFFFHDESFVALQFARVLRVEFDFLHVWCVCFQKCFRDCLFLAENRFFSDAPKISTLPFQLFSFFFFSSLFFCSLLLGCLLLQKFLRKQFSKGLSISRFYFEFLLLSGRGLSRSDDVSFDEIFFLFRAVWRSRPLSRARFSDVFSCQDVIAVFQHPFIFKWYI